MILASCINKTRNTTLWLLYFYGLKQCGAFKVNNKPLTKESTACHSIHTYRKSFQTPWQFSVRSTPLQTPKPPSHVRLAEAQLSIFHTIEINFNHALQRKTIPAFIATVVFQLRLPWVCERQILIKLKAVWQKWCNAFSRVNIY